MSVEQEFVERSGALQCTSGGDIGGALSGAMSGGIRTPDDLEPAAQTVSAIPPDLAEVWDYLSKH